jgi:hypothetical protein
MYLSMCYENRCASKVSDPGKARSISTIRSISSITAFENVKTVARSMREGQQMVRRLEGDSSCCQDLLDAPERGQLLLLHYARCHIREPLRYIVWRLHRSHICNEALLARMRSS